MGKIEEKLIAPAIAWALRNYALLLVCAISILALSATYYNVAVYEQACNEHWEKQYCDLAEMFQQDCYGPSGYVTPTKFNAPMNVTVPGLDIQIGEVQQ